MGTNLVHHLLVTTDKLQRVPVPLMVVLFGMMGGVVFALWPTDTHPVAALVTVIVCCVNWGILWALPHQGRSWGPERPPTIVLAFLSATLTMAIGVMVGSLGILLVAQAILVGIVYYSTWHAPFRVMVSHEQLTVASWLTSRRSVRLLHLSDLHLERFGPRERKLNRLIRQLEPDLIVFTGDYVNVSYTHDPMTETHIRQLLADWSAPLGVYCIPGTYTVEPIDRVRAFTQGLSNLCLMQNQWVSVDTAAGWIHICGLHTTHDRKQDTDQLKQLWEDRPMRPGLYLLLNHPPDVAPAADALGFDLYLCGHTHGGQLRLPFIGPIFTGSALGRRFAMGRYNLTQMTLYTSRGIGLEGMGAPRARLFCPPEIVLWTLNASEGEGES